jgi:hypothetical protein
MDASAAVSRVTAWISPLDASSARSSEIFSVVPVAISLTVSDATVAFEVILSVLTPVILSRSIVPDAVIVPVTVSTLLMDES